MIKKMKKFDEIFYMLRLLWRSCPQRVWCEFARRILQNGVNLYTSTIFLEYIVNSIEKRRDFKDVVFFIVFSVIGIMIVHAFFAYCYQIAVPKGNQVLYEKLNLIMFKKANEVEVACYENTSFYKKYTKASSQIKSNALKTIEFSSRMVAETVSLVYIVVKLFFVDKFAIIVGIVPLILSFILQKYINQKRYDLDMANVESERKKEYVNRVIFQAEYAKEIRLSNIKNVMFDKFNCGIDELNENVKKYGRPLAILMMLQGLVSGSFVFALVNIYSMVRLLLFKNITAGGYVILGNLLMTFYSQCSAFTIAYGRLSSLGRYVKNLKEFLEYVPKIAQSQEGIVPEGKEHLIEIKNVSFSYVEGGQEILKDINITINPGEVIALVGHNGAGKTTLAKLIMRLYDPVDGEILLDHKNIKEYQVKAYRKLFGAVFQDYGVLALNVAENVMMRKVKKEDEEIIRESLNLTGIYDKIIKHKKNIYAPLTKEFEEDGMVLSGGENQKIAISRVYAKDCDIAILDEPSSALDPVAEFEMYRSMMKSCQKKSVIFISHRMASATLADRIYYLENGKIEECGTHSELMNNNGKYAELFRLQAKGYRRSINE